jgi:hypothetical protein
MSKLNSFKDALKYKLPILKEQALLGFATQPKK